MSTRRLTSSSWSTRSPFDTTSGRAASRVEGMICRTARTGATTTDGGSGGEAMSSATAPNRQRTFSRWPIVWTSGLTRSNGRVSHAGNISTAPGSANNLRSCQRRSASVAVGVTTKMGERFPLVARAAST